MMKDGKKPSILEVNKKFKDLIQNAKAMKKIKPHTDAFEKFPVQEEKHKGKNEYFN